jgi:hypothetical protein
VADGAFCRGRGRIIAQYRHRRAVHWCTMMAGVLLVIMGLTAPERRPFIPRPS